METFSRNSPVTGALFWYGNIVGTGGRFTRLLCEIRWPVAHKTHGDEINTAYTHKKIRKLEV